ncbi:Dihydroorotate dehydrogenase (quinone), mitochondrial [Tilletia horrida]|uniref:Dihydroorotate dehydrogenase (quinone), mitochondrial n=1 Tax=Tilletia horrida TaxID=155126 RepID=A0AAN6G8J5_9BASI|nr:Dihydroorotate dehydrogenase (quinone), mitochondrial [Tilletia horrida]
MQHLLGRVVAGPAGVASASAVANASARRSCLAAAASAFHTSSRVRADGIKDALKSAAASTAAAGAEQKAQIKGGQVIASARDTAAKLASAPSVLPKAPATPSPPSSWTTGSSSSKSKGKGTRPLRSALNATLFLVGGTFLYYYYRDSRAAIHRWIAIPALKYFLDPESAQKLAIDLLVSGVAPIDVVPDDELLKTELFGMTLSNPIGLAAGFDKQAQAIDGLFDLGFGIVEVGSVTPEPQPGNPLPRYFRLVADDAAINRFGFNSDGHAAVLTRLRSRVDRWLLATDALAPSPSASSKDSSAQLESRTSVTTVPHTAEQLPDLVALDAEAALVRAGEVNPRTSTTDSPRLSLRPDRLLSINLGKNKTTPEHMAVRDYILGIHALGPYADLLVVNVSSPNTPGLRDLQRAEVLGSLLGELVQARDQMIEEQEKLAASVSCPAYSPNTDGKRGKPLKPTFRVPLLLKISPDLSESELNDIADAAKKAKVDGLIVSNTTVQRPRSLIASSVHDDPVVNEAGGLSGRPLKPLSLRALRHLSARLQGADIPLIGCGGIFSGADALEFAKAGASAVQIYTSFGYTGVGAPRRIKDELLELLKKEGKSWKDVIGADAQE